MKKLLFIIIILFIFIVIGLLVYREGSLPVDKTSKVSKTFTIKPGESMNVIINNLAHEELIRNKVVFYVIVKHLGIERNIQAGQFNLSQSMPAEDIAKSLTHGTADTWVTIIEGLRKEEVAEIISQKFQIPEIEFTNIATEGYLFPDTYLIPHGATSEKILSILTETFNKKYSDDLKQKARVRHLTDREVVTLASLVEREARTDADKQEVANIMLRRLRADWYLNVDATIQYVLGYQRNEKRWWKKELTTDDLEINSPYNTYKTIGLPPTPICSPGLASLKAVANANDTTPYWYYVSDKNGKLHFATTLEEQQRNISKYL